MNERRPSKREALLPTVLPMKESSEDGKKERDDDPGGSSGMKGGSSSSRESGTDKAAASTSKALSDGHSKEVGECEPSPARKVPVGSKRNEPDSQSTASPYQAKQARLNEKTRAPVKNDSVSESDDRYYSADDEMDKKVSAKDPDGDRKDPHISEESMKPISRRIKRKGSRLVPFPVMMYQLLSDDKYQDALCWLPDGLSFVIDPDVFYEKVIQVHYPGSKLDSFKRKLNRWGFHRVTEMVAPGTMTYEHRLFRRGCPDLLPKMDGGRVMAKNKNKNGSETPPPPGPSLQSLLSLTNRTSGLTLDQQAAIAAILTGASGLSGGLGLTNGGISSSTIGSDAILRQQFPPTGEIPGMSTNFLSHAQALEAMQGTDMGSRTILGQEQLRLELMRKAQEELQLKQRANEEVLRRRLQERQLLEAMILSSNPTTAPSQDVYLQMPRETTAISHEVYLRMPCDMASASNQPGPSAGFNLEGAVMNRFPTAPSSMNHYVDAPQAALQQQHPDASGQMLSQAPPASNESDLFRFRDLEQQRAQNFVRLMEEEIARRQREQSDPNSDSK